MTGYTPQFTYTPRRREHRGECLGLAVTCNRRPSGNGRKLLVQVKSDPQTADSAETVALQKWPRRLPRRYPGRKIQPNCRLCELKHVQVWDVHNNRRSVHAGLQAVLTARTDVRPAIRRLTFYDVR